jgi:hypothetical protein
MAAFAYKAMDANGKSKNGVLEEKKPSLVFIV